MGTMVPAVAALLIHYHETFPHVPLPILPLLPGVNVWLWARPFWSWYTSLVLLVGLSHWHRRGSRLGVVCGLLSGVLLRLTGSFWTEAYWASGWILVILVGTLASLKEEYGAYLPCIDSVEWLQDDDDSAEAAGNDDSGGKDHSSRVRSTEIDRGFLNNPFRANFRSRRVNSAHDD